MARYVFPNVERTSNNFNSESRLKSAYMHLYKFIMTYLPPLLRAPVYVTGRLVDR